MPWWSALLMIAMFEKKKSAAAVLRRDLEIGGTDAYVVVLSLPVLAIRNESSLYLSLTLQ